MLTLALQNALSGLRVNQQALAVISQNISNANNPDYSRQQVVQESVALGGMIGNGVIVKSVERVVDTFISKSVVTKTSIKTAASTIKDYYNQAQQYFGQPGLNNSIDSYTDAFFNSLNTLQNNPKDSSFKRIAVAAADTVAKEVSALSHNIQDMRLQADKQINESVKNVNFLVKQLQDLNANITGATNNNASVVTFLDAVQANLNKLAEEINIDYHFAEDNTVVVTATNGQTLLAGGARYELDYTPALAVDDFVNGVDLSAIDLYAVSLDGTRNDEPATTLATAGAGPDIVSKFTGGRIKGLMDARDKILPEMLAQLDNFAVNLRDEVNAVHNDGSAFPPVASLTGTTLVDPTSSLSWSGKVMIAALNADGTPVTSNYSSDLAVTGKTPFTLDLSALNDGNGAGKPSMQTIIDEINQYYGAPQPRVKMGGLTNITLAAASDAIDSNSGTFKFNLDLSNFGTKNSSVVVTGVSVDNGATVSTGMPLSATAVTAGTSKRSGDITLNMAAGSSAASVNISVTVQVTDADGNVNTNTIVYNVSEATTDLMNHRFSAASVSGTGDAEIESATGINPILTAKLVDANGDEVSKDTSTGDYLESGYLVIAGVGDNRVAISELDSQDLGNSTTEVDATNRGFSHYFGLNNFFVETSSGVTNAAYNMKLRADILAKPGLISMGKLTQVNTNSAVADYTYEVAESSNTTIRNMLELNVNNNAFEAAGELSSISTTFSGYAAQMIAYNSAATKDAQAKSAQADLIHSGFADKDKNIRGVNIDEEMGNTIVFQNAYAANARVINVVNGLFEDLLSVFR